jgi:hypothetical protein
MAGGVREKLQSCGDNLNVSMGAMRNNLEPNTQVARVLRNIIRVSWWPSNSTQRRY